MKRILQYIKNFLVLRDKEGKRYRKSVMLYGFYGENLGDDLFFEKLLTRYPNTMFLIYCTENYRGFFEKYNNAKFYSVQDGFVQKINKIGHKIGVKELFESVLLWRSNATVHIGGSIYQQIGDWRLDLSLRKKRKRPFKPFFSISSNFGAYTDKEFESAWRKQFKKYEDVCFRDKYSYEIFSGLESSRYAPDLLFSYRLPEEREIEGSVAISVYNPFFGPRNTPEEISNNYRLAIAKTAADLLSEGKKVTLLGFCSLEGDDALAASVIDCIPSELRDKISLINYSFETKDEILKIISRSEYVIGTRLHAVILGLAAGKKVLPLVYNQKIANILGDIGFGGPVIPVAEMPRYAKEGMAHILKEAEPFDAGEYKNSDEKQFARLDKFLSAT